MIARTIRKISMNVRLIPGLGVPRFTCGVRASAITADLNIIRTYTTEKGFCKRRFGFNVWFVLAVNFSVVEPHRPRRTLDPY